MVEKLAVDINTADEEELTAIPGIGPVLAQRVIEARPYTSIDDVSRVSGISYTTLTRMQPHITVSTNGQTEDQLEVPPLPAANDSAVTEYSELAALPAAPDEREEKSEEDLPVEETFEKQTLDKQMLEKETPEEQPALVTPPPLPTAIVKRADTPAPQQEVTDAEEGEAVTIPPEPMLETESEEQEIESQLVSEPAAKPGPKLVTRAQFIWIGLLIFILAIAFGVALSLGVLAGMNGGLRYVAPERITAISREVTTLTNRASTMQDSLEAVQARLDNLEALSGRIDQLESTTSSIQEEVGTLTTDVANIESSLDALEEETGALRTELDTLSAQSSRFQSVMDGLRDLLNNLFPVK